MSALTLLQASEQALGNDEVKRAAIIELFAVPDILRVMPFMDVPGGAYTYIQEGQLPGVAFRGINESYGTSTGVINPQVERLRIAGGDLDVDKALIKTHGAGIRSSQERMKVKALSLYLADKMINGDSEADPRQFDGLRKRITGSQLFPAGNSSGGDALSLAILDEAIDAVDGPTHLIMNKKMRNLLSQAAKKADVAGNLEWFKDDFGNRVAFYNDLPILVTDYNDQNEQIIGFNESAPGGGADEATSVYIVSIGDEGVMGLQNGPMDVEDLGEIDSQPVLRTRLEWLISMAVLSGRAAARVWGIKNAAIVS